MNEKLLIIDFGSSKTHYLAQILRKYHIYTHIIKSNQKIELTPDIKGIILLADHDSPPDSINFENIDIPILGIEGGSWILALSYNAKINEKSYSEYNKTNKINNIHQQNWILCKYRNHPLFIGIPHCHYINHNKIKNIFGNDIINLCINHKGIPTTFQISNKNFFGIQYFPIDSNLIWKNFLHICKSNQSWQMNNLIPFLNNEFKEKIGNESIVIFYSGGLKSLLVTLLLKSILEHKQITLIIIKTGLQFNDYYLNSLNLIQNTGLSYIEINIEKEVKNILKTNSKNLRNELLKLIMSSCYLNSIPSLTYLVNPELIDENIDWLCHHQLITLKPFKYFYRSDLIHLGKYFNIPENLLYQHHIPPESHFGNLNYHNLKLIQLIDYLWIESLKEDYYYHQLKRAGATILNKYIVSLWAYDLEGSVANLPFDWIQKIINKIKYKIKNYGLTTFDLKFVYQF